MNQNIINAIINTLLRRDGIINMSKSYKKRKAYMESIADSVFLFIEQNLMSEYIAHIAAQYDKTENDPTDKTGETNIQIAKWISRVAPMTILAEKPLSNPFDGLESKGECFFPRSTLISSYTKHVEK